jgi:hypothetical protein
LGDVQRGAAGGRCWLLRGFQGASWGRA